ncbi:pyruvate ferredoxin oxidoreductase [Candidatus Parcubacteria bacterium]|nr:MAG: pyruvate ferredoxin oxidoreductase [Candidatus Parcubacteria bacterium]
MYQIRIHGRGGQGVVTAAELIAIAAFNDGHESQAFPHFGVERTGAPIQAYARIDDKPIRTREHVYKPDALIVQDPTLIGTVDLAQGCHKDTILIVNSSLPKDQLGINFDLENIYVIDATNIALDILGKNIVNTVILGTLAKINNLISLEGLTKAIKQKFAGKDKSLVEKNIKAVTKAFNS